MKLSLPILLSTITLSSAFLAPPSPRSSTALNQRSLGFDTNDLYTREESERFKQQSKITHFVKKLRTKTAITPLGKKVLVSGFEPEDPSATMVLDFLNAEESKMYFPFDTIVAHVPDGKVAKKRMIGRNARYTGLLDKLEFSEGETLIPNAEQLEGVQSWVVHVAGGDMGTLGKVVDAAEGAADVKNVAILLSGAGGADQKALNEMNEMMKTKATSFAYTVVVVPEWNDVPEAQCAYSCLNVTDVAEAGPFASGETFSREESLRIVTECLAIDGAKGKCVVANAFPDKTSVEGMLIQSMRETGFSRIEEVGMMVMNGSKGCMKLIEDEEKSDELKVDERLQRTPEQKKALEEKAALDLEERQKQAARNQSEERTKKILQEYAYKWAEREYYRKSIKRPIPGSKESFIKTVWDRAVFEAKLWYRMEQGEDLDVTALRAEWQAKQREKVRAGLSATLKELKEGLL